MRDFTFLTPNLEHWLTMWQTFRRQTCAFYHCTLLLFLQYDLMLASSVVLTAEMPTRMVKCCTVFERCRGGLVVSTPDCGARGPLVEPTL